MPKIFMSVLLFACCITLHAQDASVEKSIFNIQTGLVGVWVSNELRLSNSFALRTEAGLELGALSETTEEDDNVEYVGAATFSVAPRWYYNLKKRTSKGKSIAKNTGNYFALKGMYVPDWGLVAGPDDAYLVTTVAVLPSWGIRRVYGKHFTFETGIGIGPMFAIGKDKETLRRQTDVYIDLQARIGYTF